MGQDDDYFSRQRITIYEDPRDIMDSRTDRRGEFMTGNGNSGSLYSSRLDIRPSPLRFRNYEDEQRDNFRYRSY